MTADDWEPSEEIVKAYHDAQQKALRECEDMDCFSDHEFSGLCMKKHMTFN